MTTRCHSVRSRRSPEALSRQLSEVAMDRFATREPSCRLRISGSRPRLPIKITLLTLPAIALEPQFDAENSQNIGFRPVELATIAPGREWRHCQTRA